MIKPTCVDLYYGNDGNSYESIHRVADDGWRHGNIITEVFRRKSDNTFWKLCYRISTDGETNELRDNEGDLEIYQVEPVEKTVITYEPVLKN